MTRLEKLNELVELQNQLILNNPEVEYLDVGEDHPDCVAQKEVFEAFSTGFAQLKVLTDREYIEIPKEAFDDIRKCLLMKPYWLYDKYAVREGLDEAALEPYAADLEKENFSALLPLLNKVTNYVSTNYALFRNFLSIIGLLFDFTLALAHRAKHMNTQSAGVVFLRAASIINRFKRNFATITEDKVDDFFDYFERGLEELSIATDYFNLKPWNEFIGFLPEVELK